VACAAAQAGWWWHVRGELVVQRALLGHELGSASIDALLGALAEAGRRLSATAAGCCWDMGSSWVAYHAVVQLNIWSLSLVHVACCVTRRQSKRDTITTRCDSTFDAC
jgi:hypothetical protein